MEGIVLLWIEYFQQSRSRVTVVGVLRHFVDFIEDEDGVARTGSLDRLNDTSGHRTDIGTTVSADLSLVVQTTQRHTDILTFHRGGNRLTQ